MKTIKKLFIGVVGLSTVLLSSCGLKPYQEEVYVEVKPNETAYVIPLETGNKENQTKLKSESYLDANKVASKRIYVPTQWHKQKRDFLWMNGDGQWIPSVRVILVDRSPVTREWTELGEGSDINKKENIKVESRESIGFSFGVTATASIPEELATRFLYKYNGRSLAQVMDNDVRGYIQNILTSEFGIRNLSQCQSERKTVFDKMRKDVTEHFKQYGVEIMNIGASGGFNYSDQSIQIAINDKFNSEMKITAAKNEVDAARKFAEAKSSIEAQKNLDADINIKNAIADGIRSGKIPVPSTIAGGNISIMELYGLKSFTNKR